MMINTIVDSVVTCIETWMLFYLLQNEQLKGGKGRQAVLFVVLVMGIIIMTRLDFPVWPKFFFNIIVLMTLGQLIYSCSMLKLLFYGIVYFAVLIFSGEIPIGIWNIFNEPIVADNMVYEDFVPSVFLVYLGLFFFSMTLLKKITSKEKNEGINANSMCEYPFLVSDGVFICTYASNKGSIRASDLFNLLNRDSVRLYLYSFFPGSIHSPTTKNH